MEPLVPVMVMVNVPVGVKVASVVTVRVEEPEVLTEAGLNVAVAPAGRPLALKVTVPLNEPTAATVAVYVVLFPCVTACDAGVAVSVKSGVTGTQEENLNEASRVFQLKLPVAGRYSLACQKVQSSEGSMAMLV